MDINLKDMKPNEPSIKERPVDIPSFLSSQFLHYFYDNHEEV